MSETVPSGTTETVPSGTTKKTGGVLTVEGNLVVEGRVQVVDTLTATASDSDSSTTSATRKRDLLGSGVDADTSQAIRTRLRTIQGQASDADTATARTTRVRALLTQATDADTSQAISTRLRTIQGQASDADTATARTTRVRALLTQATDVDATQAVLTRGRKLVGEATDADTAVLFVAPKTAATDPRTAIIEILDGSGLWPGDVPVIKPIEETTPKQRQNTTTPAIYAHKPVADTIERFSADGLDLTEDETVELYIYILEPEDNTPPGTVAREYRNRVVNILAEYMNDNYSRTEFHSVEPTGATDARASTIARQTDHHVYSVEVETHRLQQDL